MRHERNRRHDRRACTSLPAVWIWPIGMSIALILSSCGGGAPSLLDPHGPAADHLARLIWIVFAIAAAVVLIVFLALLIAAFKRHQDADEPAVTRGENRIILIGGVVLPAIVLLSVFGFSLVTTNYLSNPPTQPRLTVNIVGHQWWWEVQYPDQGFATANELHIPVGQAVRIVTSSDDVIHDFWVPQLQAKIDVFPGRTTGTWLQAAQPGSYKAECAEFCGVEHAKMNLIVVADPPAQYEQWLAAQSRPAAQPADQAQNILLGYQVFIGSSCNRCHAINGTTATGASAPDLTHLATRQTLAAGTIPNSRGNLAAWIANTQGIKPGNKMPAYPLDAQSMQYLLDYLQSLQ